MIYLTFRKKGVNFMQYRYNCLYFAKFAPYVFAP